MELLYIQILLISSLVRNLHVGQLCNFLKLSIKFHYIFIIAQLWLTSHPRSTVVLIEHSVYNRGVASSSLTIGIFNKVVRN